MTRSLSGSPLATPKSKLTMGDSLLPQALNTAPELTTADIELTLMRKSRREDVLFMVGTCSWLNWS
jgi:hypothetical protein